MTIMANTFLRRKKGNGCNLSSTPSLSSIDSFNEGKEEQSDQMLNPTTLHECDDHLETYQILQKSKMQELSNLSEQLRSLRSQKEPLVRIKEALHEEISKSNIAINAKSEEVTQLKHKLRHHSERQIQDNIERLEFQLRNNNYKPREEQKILDEIYMLKRSFKTLKEFELKQRENKKYRSERHRLIEQRNEVFSKMQASLLLEEEIKKGMTELRDIINATKKTTEHLKSLRPELEKIHMEEMMQKEEIRLKRLEEKTKTRKEQYLKRQQERQKRWEEYEASREPYEDEKDLCRMLLSYMQAANRTPTSAAPAISLKESEEPSKVCNGGGGVFYTKPKDAPEREKKRSRKRRVKKKKELSHPPDVIANFDTLSIALPKTTDDLGTAIDALQHKFKYFERLGANKVNAPNNQNVDKPPAEQENVSVPFPILSVDNTPAVAPPHKSPLPTNKIANNPKSFFSVSTMGGITGPPKMDNSLTPTYASVTAKIGV